MVELNPLSCFFTSFYDDVRELEFDNFMRHFPAGEIPRELPEFDLLKNDENWCFDSEIAFGFMPVPIHRYKREEVQEILEIYGGIQIDELVLESEIIYLESTDCYYNFTSDYGPGQFKCTEGSVHNGVIKLYRDAEGSERVVLTIAKENGKYVIKSFQVE